MATSLEEQPPVTHVRNFEVTIPGLGLQVGFFTQVTGFSYQYDVLEYPEGGRNDMVHRLPTRAKQGNITLKRGVTGERAMMEWIKKNASSPSPENLSVALYDSEGNRLQTWSFANAYPVKWTGTDLNAGGTEFLTESLEIAHSGMEVK
jgi:phage tail-like protein